MGPNDPDIGEDGLRELRDIRLRRGLSQADLSAKTGVAEFTISQIEAGKRANPRPSTLRKLAQALEVEVADLYGSLEHPLAEASPSPEQPPLNGFELERRFIDYRSCREALDHFCEYWEQMLAEEMLTEDLLDRRTWEDFGIAVKLTSKLLKQLWTAERAEVRIRHGEDPRRVDVSDPWPPGLIEESELGPAIERWMTIGLEITRIATERFGDAAAGGAAEITDLRDFARRKAS